MNIIDMLAISIHIIAATLWVGGIFLVFQVFRPAAMSLEPPIRLKLFLNVFSRFFPWVWLFIVLLVLSGYWDWQSRFSALEPTPIYLHAMHIIGWVMIALFAWLYFKPFAQLKKAIAEENYPLAGATINTKMKPIIIINLTLGLLEAIIGVTGPYW